MQFAARKAVLLKMIRYLPKNDRKRAEYEIMTAWIASRRKDDQVGQHVGLIDGRWSDWKA